MSKTLKTISLSVVYNGIQHQNKAMDMEQMKFKGDDVGMEGRMDKIDKKIDLLGKRAGKLESCAKSDEENSEDLTRKLADYTVWYEQLRNHHDKHGKLQKSRIERLERENEKLKRMLERLESDKLMLYLRLCDLRGLGSK